MAEDMKYTMGHRTNDRIMSFEKRLHSEDTLKKNLGISTGNANKSKQAQEVIEKSS